MDDISKSLYSISLYNRDETPFQQIWIKLIVNTQKFTGVSTGLRNALSYSGHIVVTKENKRRYFNKFAFKLNNKHAIKNVQQFKPQNMFPTSY